jgi:hypothetical protein
VARRIFTQDDLGRLRDLLDAPLIKEALRSATPIKRQASASAPPAEEVVLSAPVRSRDDPDGVPLTSLLDAIKVEVPTATGIAVRGSRVVVTHERLLRPAERKKLDVLLGDRDRLLKLRPPRLPDGGGPPPDGGRPLPVPDEITRMLLDAQTPDREWLQAFRRYAVGRLIERPPG